MKRGDIKTNTNEIQRIMRESFESLYSNKLENLEEVDNFLDALDLTKLIQEDINHLNRSIRTNVIKAVIVPQQRKAQDSMDSLPNSTRPLKKN
jgi:Mg2+/Co2+ transporter CorC